ncbi:hypothetical protein Ae201684_007635 [Aphanomyces euteiches]|uniref:START domain-containing protein n=1 Tax=Aphanomyces euteiches TaxID=100861 RepID=A0A6G0X7S4_9STRA|nr:hypothetical protein Ae201684_007635 [Aphanomyces euteiches]KAH9138523.1 hypothetical protein AeRB84_017188 [Aphanomyces euteiches]
MQIDVVEELWDVQTDLHFLFQGAENVPSEVTINLIDITTAEEDLSDDPKPNGKRKSKAKTSTVRKPFEAMRRQELAELKQQVESLQNQLVATKSNATSQRRVFKWEKIARHQRHQARKALEEQKYLQQTIQANVSFIGTITSQMQRRLELVAHDAWRDCKLPADKFKRHAAIHAIAERQYNLKDTEYINSGMMDCDRNLFRVRTVPQTNEHTLVLEVVSQTTLPVPCEIISHAVWQVFNGEKSPAISSSAVVTMEQLDDNTVYEQFSETHHGLTSYSNTVRKYFVTNDEHVIVVRSVLEDELVANMSKGAVENQIGWITVVPLDAKHCRIAYLMRTCFDATTFPSREGQTDTSIDAIEKSMRQVTVHDSPPEAGVFPADPSYLRLMVVPPGFETFFFRGFQFKSAHREVIKAAVLAFQDN